MRRYPLIGEIDFVKLSAGLGLWQRV